MKGPGVWFKEMNPEKEIGVLLLKKNQESKRERQTELGTFSDSDKEILRVLHRLVQPASLNISTEHLRVPQHLPDPADKPLPNPSRAPSIDITLS